MRRAPTRPPGAGEPAPRARTELASGAPGPIWSQIVGQERALQQLRGAIDRGAIAHAYAFVGPPGVGRRLAALGLAQAALCASGGCGTCAACRRVAAGHHPDCQVLAPTPPRDNPRGLPALRIGEVRELMHWAALAPLLGPRKVFIVDEAERMTLPTAQALLKTLEEPPPRTLLVLILGNPRALPPTVLSRCQQVRFRPLEVDAAAALLRARGAEAEAADLLARLSRGQVGLVVEADPAEIGARRAAALELLEVAPALLVTRLDELAPDRATVAAWLETYALWYRDALCLAAGGSPALLVNHDRQPALADLARRAPVAALARGWTVIKEAWLALEGNLNPRLALEHVLLALGREATAGAR
jgi:DNA polymerase-3 subunit delta'